MTQLATSGTPSVVHDIVAGEEQQDYVTFAVHGQLFGIPVRQVQDILKPQRIASIPLAPTEVRGSINLRGRIVTVIDVRARLGLDKPAQEGKSMGVTVEHQHELYTLLVDDVGDVIRLAKDTYEPNPSTLNAAWREFADCIHRLEDRLMVVLDVERLLDFRKP